MTHIHQEKAYLRFNMVFRCFTPTLSGSRSVPTSLPREATNPGWDSGHDGNQKRSYIVVLTNLSIYKSYLSWQKSNVGVFFVLWKLRTAEVTAFSPLVSAIANQSWLLGQESRKVEVRGWKDAPSAPMFLWFICVGTKCNQIQQDWFL